MSDFSEIQQIADRYQLSFEELHTLLQATDEMRGVLTAADLERGLSAVLQTYIHAMAAAAERFTDPAERMVADRVVRLTVELLSGQLEAAPHPSN